MESDTNLTSALEALGDLTTEDLNEMLDFDMPATPTTDILSNNREELSSQLDDNGNSNDISTDFRSPQYEFLSNLTHSNDTSLIILERSNLSIIDVDNSRKAIVDESIKSNNQYTTKTSELSASSNYLESSFDQEFEEINDSDFELPLFGDDSIAALDEEDAVISEKEHRVQLSKDYPKHEYKSNTQIIPGPSQESQFPPQNISASCPSITAHTSTFLLQNSTEKSPTNTLQNEIDATDFLQLTEDETAQFEELFNFSEDIENDKESFTTTNTDEAQFDSNHFASDVTAIPSSVQQLYDLMKPHYSNFSFVYALCAQLCQDRVPMGCFVNVKLALVLSIASIGKNPDIPPVPIIIMGNDSYMADYLLTSIADLANRFVGPVEDVKPPSSDGFCNRVWIEADPIQLAKGGVFYVGDWSCLKPLRSENIFKNIETSTVAVERTTRIYPLDTAIWGHWQAFKYNAKDQSIFNKFVKIFGIPIYMDDSNHETLVDYMLKQASVQLFESTVDHLSISSDDMRTFLAVISKRTVDLTPEATALLKKYFVASRIERPDCLTKQAFVVLKQFAESFAKLSLRHEVLEIDAVGAIFMCEHFLQHIYGAGMDPPPVLEAGNFVGNVDGHIANFHEWARNYIAKYCDRE